MDSQLATHFGQTSGGQSAFQKAFDKYIDSLPKNKQKNHFIITACYDPSNPITPQIVSDSITKIKVNRSSKSSAVSKVIEKVVRALKDYDEVFKCLASADPMPTAIIWGALSVIVNGVQRHYDLLNTIEDELRSLANVIDRISEYEDLWGECPIFQDLFCDSYVKMFRFWNRVYKELTKPGYKSAASAAFSNCSKKLKDIVDQIKADVEGMKSRSAFLAEKEDKEERERAEQERDAQSDWRKEQKDEEMRNTICKWLREQKVTAANLKRNEEFQGQRMLGTCDWLSEHREYLAWLNRTTCNPVLRLHAPPGSGKSILCSRVIQTIQNSDPTMAVAYHFYRFDEPFSASDVLRHLALQLFDRYAKSNFSSDVLKDLLQKVQGVMGPLQCAKEIIATVVTKLPEVHLFLDGLDEESMGERWKEAETIINVLLTLAKQWPNSVRVWSSSQNVDCVIKAFKAYSALDIKEEMKQDMIFYLSNEMTRFEICKEDKECVLGKVDDRAAGNFLWAKLMVMDLKKANSPADMKRIIKEGPTLDGYYKRYFERIEVKDRSLTCYIFALIAFARRPLRIRELREAIGMLKSRDARLHHKGAVSLDPDEKPYPSSMAKLFAPLIEVEVDIGCDPEDRICRLYHSTVLKFLCGNPSIFCDGLAKDGKPRLAGPQITPMVIADACLLYLSQERYSHLLVSRPTPENGRGWFDVRNDPVVNHHFLSYSAKYWDKHFDWFHRGAEITQDVVFDESDNIVEPHILINLEDLPEYNRVKEFLDSPNFQTCIQVQSLFVDAHFESFHGEDGEFLKRVFPDWFIWKNRAYKLNYHHFLHEWKLLLNSVSSESWSSPASEYAGEIDRCWWTSLGPHNFLSKMNGRYTTFRFQKDGVLGPRPEKTFEGINCTGDKLKILRITSCPSHREQLELDCEHWELSGAGPTRQMNQTLKVQTNLANWLQYVHHEGEASNPSRFSQRKDRAFPVELSQDCESLRIGTQIYTKKNNGEYAMLPTFRNKQGRLPYIEEFASRGHFVVIAKRRCAIREARLLDPKLTTDSPNESDSVHCGESSSDSGSDDSSDREDSSSESDDEAYESWSDCSSGNHEDSESDLDDEGSIIHDDESDLSDPEPPEDNDSLDSGSEESDVDPRAFEYGQWRNYGEEYWSDEEEFPHFSPFRKKHKGRQRTPQEPRPSISVFDIQSPVPKKIFHFSQKLPFILYDSHPVIHPSQSLVVWPLGGGHVLFADFGGNTFFIRKLRASTPHTRQIFMKCHFSVCGRFLHVAVLEGQHKPLPKQKQVQNEVDPKVKLALFVSTYRLCNKQASRSPPSLIHSARVELGLVTSLSVSPLPFTLTWMPKVLYLTCRHVTLRVHQIRLFQPDVMTKEMMKPCVARPREIVLLPDTAVERDVYYFPPLDGSGMARIIIGSDPTVNNSPPVGCFVHEQNDLGGWVGSDDCRDVLERRSVGQFTRLLEKFDPEEDCDLEPFLFLG